MSKEKIQLVPNKPRKPTGKVVAVQPNDVVIETETGFLPSKIKLVPVKSDKHEEK